VVLDEGAVFVVYRCGFEDWAHSNVAEEGVWWLELQWRRRLLLLLLLLIMMCNGVSHDMWRNRGWDSIPNSLEYAQRFFIQMIVEGR